MTATSPAPVSSLPISSVVRRHRCRQGYRGLVSTPRSVSPPRPSCSSQDDELGWFHRRSHERVVIKYSHMTCVHTPPFPVPPTPALAQATTGTPGSCKQQRQNNCHKCTLITLGLNSWFASDSLWSAIDPSTNPLWCQFSNATTKNITWVKIALFKNGGCSRWGKITIINLETHGRWRCLYFEKTFLPPYSNYKATSSECS